MYLVSIKMQAQSRRHQMMLFSKITVFNFHLCSSKYNEKYHWHLCTLRSRPTVTVLEKETQQLLSGRVGRIKKCFSLDEACSRTKLRQGSPLL